MPAPKKRTLHFLLDLFRASPLSAGLFLLASMMLATSLLFYLFSLLGA